MQAQLRIVLAAVLLSTLAAAGAWAADDPGPPGETPTLSELFSPPYPFGVGARSLALADDGAYLACAWDDSGYGNRDLWVYDVALGTWYRQTSLWPEREARRRREFQRQLAKDREAWEEEHAAEAEVDASDEGGEAAGEADAEDAAEVAAAEDEEQFDEEERIEEFEKDLKKQRDTFGGVGQIIFRRGGHEVLWLFEGAIYSLNLDEPSPKPCERLRHEQGFYALRRLEDSDTLLLASENDVLLWWPGDGRLRQLTSGGWADFDNASAFALSTDQRWLAAVRRDYTAVRKQRMPDLLPDDPSYTEHYHVRPQDTPENVRLLLYDLSEEPPWPVEVELPDEPYYQVERLEFSPLEGDWRLLCCVRSGDTQDFRAYLIEPIADAGAGEDEYSVELAYREHDERWIWRRMNVAWDNTGGLLLLSEKDGLGALYRLELREDDALSLVADAEEDEAAAPEGGGNAAGEEAGCTEAEDAPAEEDWGTHEALPLYAGVCEVFGMHPLKHSPHVILRLEYPAPDSRSLLILDLQREAERLLFEEPGLRGDSLTLSEDESLAAFFVADERTMGELALMSLSDAVAGRPVEAEVVLDRTPSEWRAWADGWDVRFLNVPTASFDEYEQIHREGGVMEAGQIPVKLWLPPSWVAGGSYPLLLYAHGAGYAQAVTRQCGFYELFHPWLAAEKGWIVAEADYRGSAGLGRDWRVDVAGRLGHPETDDLIAVKRHMVEHYGADPKRTALWGWSYGGFLTLMGLGLAPGEFPVGCAVAPVNRWDNYFYWYSTCRLGHPAENEDEYERSAAETYLEYITDDLLVIHGLRDDNTLFQSVAQYLEKGHELGVNVELKLFPSDSHGIGNEQHYIRVFEAIVDFCEVHWRGE